MKSQTVEEFAADFRDLAAGFPGDLREALGECDAASYAPESQRSSALFDPQLQHRALAWLENLSGDAG